MLRQRMLGCRALVVGLVGWGVLWLAAPRITDAAPLPPALAGAAARSPAELDRLGRLLEDRLVVAGLERAGVSPADARVVLERLSPGERAELARRADELGAGGDSAAVAILAVAIIIAALVILVLELLGRRVISRP
jgi:hypothetical protein